MTTKKSPTVLNIALTVPFLLYAYPLILLLLKESHSPVILGRYSLELAIWNLLSLVSLPLFFLAAQSRKSWLNPIPYLMIIPITYLLGSIGYLQSFSSISLVFQCCRLTAGFALILLAFRRLKDGPGRSVSLILGSLFFVLTVLDLGFALHIHTTKKVKYKNFSKFRKSYDLKQITSDDIVLIGDSFVWGMSVPEKARFGNFLEQHLKDEANVFSLGNVGGGLDEYLKTVKNIPKEITARKFILAYYIDDMPHDRNLLRALDRSMRHLRKNTPTLGFIRDKISKQLYPDVKKLNIDLIRQYDKTNPTFTGRWEDLKAKLVEFKTRAEAKSLETPLFLIIPLMVDFENYVLEEAHHDLKTEAENIGYEVIDLWPFFRKKLGDGSLFTYKNDNHFTPYVHWHVGKHISVFLENSAGHKD